jgi:DNA-directed RNA polymerase subunit M/transcription elongation factor TFIIS
MPQAVPCPRCQQVLRIREAVKESRLTCPRCLAKIDNPNLAIRTDIPGQALEMPAAITGRAICPACGRNVEKLWGYCPSCKAPLDRPYRARQRPSVDKEARSDTIASATGLILMSLLGAVGIVVFFCSGVSDIRGESSQLAGMIGMIISALLCIAVIGGIILAAQSQVQGMRIGVIVVGALVIPLLLFAAAVSFIVYSCAR